MGRPKQLLPLNGIPLVEHVLKTLAASAVKPDGSWSATKPEGN
jgi:molybdopterin-guanine dinucleotide biosynthesis protein A